MPSSSSFLFQFLQFVTFCGSILSPNIIFILTDDQGWNDVSYNGASDFRTPNIDFLANKGIKLTNSYAQCACSPSRAALMTGRYPIRYGMQHGVLNGLEPFGLPLNEIILPQYLKLKNYSTHIIGKWHLGFHRWKYTPTFRHFDTFFGYYTGKQDYYNHSKGDVYDLHNNTKCIIKDDYYSTYLYREVTKDLLYKLKNNNNPFFIYLSFQAIHNPLQAPLNIINKYKHIKDESRRIKIAGIDVLDEVIGEIYETLTKLNLWKNTILIFSSDNGGDPYRYENNYPLRGGKHTLFEGGIKVISFISGGYLGIGNLKYNYNNLFHITDWLPTILSFAKIHKTKYTNRIDGFDHSNLLLSKNISSQYVKRVILYNLDPIDCKSYFYNVCGSIRFNNFKLVIGFNTNLHLYKKRSKWTNLNNKNTKTFTSCKSYKKPNNKCPFTKYGCLYNILKDPCEYNDIRKEKPAMYKFLINKLIRFNKTQVLPYQLKYKQYKYLTVRNILNKIQNNIYNATFWIPWHMQYKNNISTKQQTNITVQLSPIKNNTPQTHKTPKYNQNYKIFNQQSKDQLMTIPNNKSIISSLSIKSINHSTEHIRNRIKYTKLITYQNRIILHLIIILILAFVVIKNCKH